MQLTIHRGANEIGGSCVELRADSGNRLILDLGMPLTDSEGEPFKLPRCSASELIERKILPGIPEFYAGQKPDANTALIISHAHQDHYGLAGFMHRGIPVHATVGTLKLLDICKVFLPRPVVLQNATTLPKSKAVLINGFEVTAFQVDHSAPDGVALSVRADGKCIVYSGDLRAGGQQHHLFESLLHNLPRNPDRLLLEGTMLSRPGRPEFEDEEAVQAKMQEIFKSKENVAFILCSSQNISRLVSVYEAARQAGCVLVIDPYVAYVLSEMRCVSPNLPQFSWANVRVLMWRGHQHALFRAGHDAFIAQIRKREIHPAEIRRNAKNIVFLARSNDTFNRITKYLVPNGLRIIWSMWKGYWERDAFVRPFCEEHGIETVYVHAGGHATADQLKELVEAVKPKCLTPIHTTQAKNYRAIFPGTNVEIVGNGASVPS